MKKNLKNMASIAFACLLLISLLGCVELEEESDPFEDSSGGIQDEEPACAEFEELSEDISVDTTLDGCYRITDSITVRDGAVLTIEPGSVLHFEQDVGLEITSKSALKAVGEADSKIWFTGEQKTKGYWKGISFRETDSTDNVLDNVIIEYGGGSYWYYGDDESNLNVNSARVRVTNTKIRNSGGWGFYFYHTDVMEFNNNLITSNTKGAGCLYSANDAEDIDSSSNYTGNDKDIVFVDSGTVKDDQTWSAIDVPYLFDGDIKVESQVTIEAGATLSFAQDASILVRSSGSLNAEGTETEPILFTGEQKTKGYWKGISFRETDSTDNVLDNVIIEYGGGSYWYYGDDESNLNVNSARVRVTNTKIRNSGGYGIYNYYGDLTKNNIEYNDNSYDNYYEYGA